jgi:type VI secretion system protein ImpI
VATVFILSAFSLNGEPIAEPKRLTALPIRIGRNGLNDYVIGHGGVSSFHARLDDVDGRLCITDLASKNGVLMMNAGASGLIKPNQPVDIQPGGFQFFLGVNVRVQVTFDQLREPLELRGALSYSGHVLGNAGVLLGTPHVPGASVQPPAPLTGPAAQFQPALAAPGRPASLPPGVGNGPGGRAATAFLQGMNAESMALQGLRELAASLVPGVPLESTGDIARFITKLHDALDAFCRSFIPLREGHAQFMSSLDLQRSRGRSLQRSHAYVAVESARDPEALAAALLNPKDRSFDAPQAVEGILADLMLHQLALLEGVMRGVRALLEELSPSNVEHQTRGGISLNRHKALWNKYQEIFENVSEERQAFALIFGPEFTAAYRQYRQTGGEGR